MQESEIRSRIDNRGWGSFFNKLWMGCGLGWMSDAMSIAALGLMLPLILTDLDLDRSEGALIVSATFVGFMVGALVSGRLADILGRRTLLIGNIVLFSLAALATGFAQDFWMLLIFRFIQGLGMGGEFPIISAYLSELSPRRYRDRLVGLTSAFYAYAFALTPLIGLLLVPMLGWRGLFCSLVIPVVFAIWIRRSLPETPVFLARKGRFAEAENALVLIEQGSTRKVEEFTQEVDGGPHGGQLLSGRTVTLIIIWVLIFFSQYGFASWIPTAINEVGGKESSGYLLTSVLFSGMIVGYLLTSFLGDRFTPRALLTFAFVEFGVSLLLFGFSADLVPMMIFGWLASAGYGFTTIAAYSYTPRQFKTSVRGTGMGIVTGIGRVGAIFGPLIVAWLSPIGSLGASFVAFGIASLVIVVLVQFLTVRTGTRTPVAVH